MTTNGRKAENHWQKSLKGGILLGAAATVWLGVQAPQALAQEQAKSQTEVQVPSSQTLTSQEKVKYAAEDTGTGFKVKNKDNTETYYPYSDFSQEEQAQARSQAKNWQEDKELGYQGEYKNSNPALDADLNAYYQKPYERYIEDDGLIFNPVRVEKQTDSGNYVHPHGDHAHLINPKNLSKTEVDLTTRVLAEPAASAASHTAEAKAEWPNWVDDVEYIAYDENGNPTAYTYTRNCQTHQAKASEIDPSLAKEVQAAAEKVIASRDSEEDKAIREAYAKAPKWVQSEYMQSKIIYDGELKYRSLHGYEDMPEMNHFHHRPVDRFSPEEQEAIETVMKRNQKQMAAKLEVDYQIAPDWAKNIVSINTDGPEVTGYDSIENGKRVTHSLDSIPQEQREAVANIAETKRDQRQQDIYQRLPEWVRFVEDRIDYSDGSAKYKYIQDDQVHYVDASTLTAQEQDDVNFLIKIEHDRRNKSEWIYRTSLGSPWGTDLIRGSKKDADGNFIEFEYKDGDGIKRLSADEIPARSLRTVRSIAKYVEKKEISAAEKAQAQAGKQSKVQKKASEDSAERDSSAKQEAFGKQITASQKTSSGPAQDTEAANTAKEEASDQSEAKLPKTGLSAGLGLVLGLNFFTAGMAFSRKGGKMA